LVSRSWVISGTYDIAIVRTHEPATLVSPLSTVIKVIMTESLDLVARPSAPGQAVNLNKLSGAPWISGPIDSTLADAIESTCRTVGGFTPNVVHRVSDAAVIIGLADQGLGVGLLPRLATCGAPRHLIHSAPGTVTRSILAVCLRESLDHRPVQALWDALDQPV
jgi:DNA-binding transcriptional LysR family regulator